MLQQVVPWEHPDQEANIRRWLAHLSWLDKHGYSTSTPRDGLTDVQCAFLRDIYALGTMPTDRALLQKVDGFIQARPAWLIELEQLIAAAKEQIQVVSIDDLLQWTDEQLIAAVKAGKVLSFTDINWGIDFLIIWDEQEQAFYDICGTIGGLKPFKSIAAHIISSLCKKIELLDQQQSPLAQYLKRRFFAARTEVCSGTANGSAQTDGQAS